MAALDQRALDALGNPVRREIMQLIADRPRPVGEIADLLPVSRPAVSKHLRILQEAELVRSETQGTRHVFHLKRDGFQRATHWLDAFWDEALSRFALVAENTTPRKPKA
ncbi:MAG: metalloregulator ArsR/SmtB family transcription factor [Myxococcota bacterium]